MPDLDEHDARESALQHSRCGPRGQLFDGMLVTSHFKIAASSSNHFRSLFELSKSDYQEFTERSVLGANSLVSRAKSSKRVLKVRHDSPLKETKFKKNRFRQVLELRVCELAPTWRSKKTTNIRQVSLTIYSVVLIWRRLVGTRSDAYDL